MRADDQGSVWPGQESVKRGSPFSLAATILLGAMSRSIIEPRYLALDSASLRRLSRDVFSTEHRKVASANAYLEGRANDGQLILVMLSHVQELIQHGNDAVAGEFPRFLRRLPCVAWVRSLGSEWPVGSILDIQASELSAALKLSSPTLRSVAEAAREGLFVFGTGVQLANLLQPIVGELRSHAISRAPERDAIAGIQTVDLGTDLQARLELLPAGDAAAHLRAVGSFDVLKDVLVRKLRKAGPKQEGHEEVADWFLTQVARDMSAILKDGDDLEAAFLEHYGLSCEDLASNQTIGELGQLAGFRAKMHLVARYASIADEARIDQLDMESIPSIVVSEALLYSRSRASRARGSDLNDTYLSALICYADLTEVDKRTHEFLVQSMRRNPSLSAVSKGFGRSPFYPSKM